MDEPQKPFACTVAECGMTFTNEDHLHVHVKKHDMVLQLGAEQRAAFVADQTPTPTRFIRNCEEVGLFQDLQNVAVNPFDEGFKRAMQENHSVSARLSLESPNAGQDDSLHTPHFPYVDSVSTLYTTMDNRNNVIISRSSSDESGTIKEYETTTISKLTNEVTTISRVVGNRDAQDKTNYDDVTIPKTNPTQPNKDNVETVYKNNVITVHSNVEIRKDGIDNRVPVLTLTDAVKNVTTDVMLNNKVQDINKPLMSQKSLDYVVDSLTRELDDGKNINRDYNPIHKDNNIKNVPIKTKLDVTPRIVGEHIEISDDEINDHNDDNYELVLKFPGGKKMRMKPVEEKVDTKKILKQTIQNKIQTVPVITNTPIVSNVLQIPTGTLIPVTLVQNPVQNFGIANGIVIPPHMKVLKVPIAKNTGILHNNVIVNTPKVIKINDNSNRNNKTNAIKSRRKSNNVKSLMVINKETSSVNERTHPNVVKNDADCVEGVMTNSEETQRNKFVLESRSAASKRYRARLKITMEKHAEENRLLREENQKLIAERAVLKMLITEHMRSCPNADDLRKHQERLKSQKGCYVLSK